MDTYIARQRFFHKGSLVKPGEELELNGVEAARYGYLGYIGATPKKAFVSFRDARALKRIKHARSSD